MADLKLFEINGEIKELEAKSVTLERELQQLIEQNMNVFFGVSFLQSEYVTSNGGRIDSLGVDENNCPVIFEYKRSMNENVINQGLFYLDWLMDHKADFELLVMKSMGKKISDALDWSIPRLICVAADFTKYDEYAVKQINRNIDLVRYKKFGEALLLFELVNSTTAKTVGAASLITERSGKTFDKTFTEQLQGTTLELRELYLSIRDYVLALGDDIAESQLKLYVAFKKIRNIVCVEVYQKQILLHLRLNPETVALEDGFTRNMQGIGHFGTGDLQIIVKSEADFEKAKSLIERAYREN